MRCSIDAISKLPKEVDGESVSVVCVIAHGDKVETRARISGSDHAFTLSDALMDLSEKLLRDVLDEVKNEKGSD